MRIRLLLAGAVLPLMLWALLPVLSEGASPKSKLNDLEHKIDATQGKIGRKKGTERVLTTQISAYTRRINHLQSKIGNLQERQATAQADLDAKQAELSRIQSDLRYERKRLVRLRARLAQARTALAQRLVELYQADAPDLVTVILSSKGFADLLERGEFMQRVSEQDQRIIKLVRDAKADATSAAQRLDVLERRQQKVTQIVQQRRDEIAQAKQGLIDTKVGLDSTRDWLYDVDTALPAIAVLRQRAGLLSLDFGRNLDGLIDDPGAAIIDAAWPKTLPNKRIMG